MRSTIVGGSSNFELDFKRKVPLILATFRQIFGYFFHPPTDNLVYERFLGVEKYFDVFIRLKMILRNSTGNGILALCLAL